MVPRHDVLLADGAIAVVRPLDPAHDRAPLDALHHGATTESLRLRFFTTTPRAADSYVEHVCTAPPEETITLVAETGGEVVALATAEVSSPTVAEVAFLVSDALHGHGIASILLEHLAAAARDRGIETFTADVLAENYAMLGVFRAAGFDVLHHEEYGVVEVRLATAQTARAQRAADEREAHAEARSLHPLLHPRSAAVVGVRRDGSGIGGAVLDSIVSGGFTGSLHVVHPSAGEVSGVPAVHRLADLDEPVDVAVLCVPAPRLEDAMADAVTAGVRAVVVISSGLREMGPEGRTIEQKLARTAREHGIRMVGPNCLGLLANDPAVRLNATFARSMPHSGALAIASQSGGVGIALLDLAGDLGLGVNSFVSLGNKADVSSNDLLMAWQDDPSVQAAALYLESFGNARKFARVARRFSTNKPLLAVVGGRSAGGQRAGSSHTAASATPSVGIAALFDQAGVIECHSAEELATTAQLLVEQPLPAGDRVAVLSNAGGFGVLGADACEQVGLRVPQLSERLQQQLATHVTATVGTSNPVDLGAGAAPAQLTGAVADLLDTDEVDALVVVLVGTAVADPEPLVEALVQVRRQHPGKPALLVTLGGVVPPEPEPGGWTRFRTMSDAVQALGRAQGYARWRSVETTDPEPLDGARGRAARTRARHLLEQGRDWLGAVEIAQLLSPYGLAPVGQVARDLGEAVAAARKVGFPVALKVADPRVLHKTDRGLVRVGVGDAPGVRRAVADFCAELDLNSVPVIVQPVVSGVEVALGLVRDPGMGPLLMVAAGGVTTEIANDRTFLLPPLSRTDAVRALHSLRMWPLLKGYRGSPPVDLDALVDLVLELGRLAEEVPEITELDLNPVLAAPEGAHVVDVRVRLAEPVGTDSGVPRSLRSLA